MQYMIALVNGDGDSLNPIACLHRVICSVKVVECSKLLVSSSADSVCSKVIVELLCLKDGAGGIRSYVP